MLTLTLPDFQYCKRQCIPAFRLVDGSFGAQISDGVNPGSEITAEWNGADTTIVVTLQDDVAPFATVTLTILSVNTQGRALHVPDANLLNSPAFTFEIAAASGNVLPTAIASSPFRGLLVSLPQLSYSTPVAGAVTGSTPNLEPCTPNPEAQTLNPTPSTLNPTPSSLNPEHQT